MLGLATRYGALWRALNRPVHASVLPMLLGAIVALCSLFGRLGAWGWMPDLLSHFYLHYTLLLIGLAVWVAATRRIGAAAALLMVALLDAAIVLSHIAVGPEPQLQQPSRHDPTAPDRPSTSQLRLVTANVHTENLQAAPLLAWIRAERPDVVVTIEVNQRWLRDLAPLAATHPYVLQRRAEDNFGIALFSRFPLRKAESLSLSAAGLPSLHVELAFPGMPLTLAAIHTMPPVGRASMELRDGQLLAMAQWCATAPGPVILTGDFNATPWSHIYPLALAASGLRDSSQGQGLQSTWPAQLGALGIPLDHAWLSPSLRVVERRVGPDIGSDHRPILLVVE